jgi:putative oxidoreductase
MDILFLLGRILFGGILLMMGMNHFTKREMLVQYAQSKEVASPGFSVFIGGLFLVLGALGILLGIYVQWAVLLLVLFFVPVTFKMHNFWAVQEPQAQMQEMVNFMKNMIILGAALTMLAIPLPWAYSLM